MRSLKLTIALIVIAGVVVNATHLATAAESKPLVTYFLDQTSIDADVPINLPADAKDVVVAKGAFSDVGGLARRPSL